MLLKNEVISVFRSFADSDITRDEHYNPPRARALCDMDKCLRDASYLHDKPFLNKRFILLQKYENIV